jgi:small GTP-binding protein
MNDFPSIHHKVVFIGDSNTGKTSIIFKYMKLAQQSFPTIAASSFPITVPIHDSVVNISCWDTAGQENYRSLVPMYSRDAEVACLVFDQTNRESFDSLEKWMECIQLEIGVKNVIIVSNKNDLDAAVPLDEAFEFCTDKKLPLVSTSALTGSNITFLFIKIAQMIRDAAGDGVERNRAPRIPVRGDRSDGAGRAKCLNGEC